MCAAYSILSFTFLDLFLPQSPNSTFMDLFSCVTFMEIAFNEIL